MAALTQKKKMDQRNWEHWNTLRTVQTCASRTVKYFDTKRDP